MSLIYWFVYLWFSFCDVRSATEGVIRGCGWPALCADTLGYRRQVVAHHDPSEAVLEACHLLPVPSLMNDSLFLAWIVCLQVGNSSSEERPGGC